MMKRLASANAALALSFGVPAFVAPVAIFAPFGVQLDPAAATIARGLRGDADRLWVGALRTAFEPRRRSDPYAPGLDAALQCS